ncbi:hypothetical protein BS47DRAFT_1338754 [Hydnum rufescens UP504]|uniref:Epoxide hydrolase n=1 Tax=Hydnum rufescens UP504 TaxID=1448309 RepID=A0A9P6B6L9_9AGAM|nr:hypothetical protein BS47DRAFT_1338754 [Hydnum rufescens UP504]
MANPPKAVIFDIGGVVLPSPIIAIRRYEKKFSLPQDYLNVQISSRGHDGAWQKFERGEIRNVYHFYEAFGRELSDTERGNIWYTQYMKKRNIPLGSVALPTKLKVDGRELFGMMMRGNTQYDEVVVEAIHRIRASKKYLVIALTNNFFAPYENILATPPSGDFNPESELAFLGWADSPLPQATRDLFDDFVDSSRVGMRKPEPGIYLLACQRNGLRPEETVMLDDIGLNLKAAQSLGMRTIHVPIGGSTLAIKQLRADLRIPLIANSGLDSKHRM